MSAQIKVNDSVHQGHTSYKDTYTLLFLEVMSLQSTVHLFHVAGTASQNSPIAVIIAVTLVNILILLVSIILLVIGVMLMVKRKRHISTVQYDQESKVHIYEDINVYRELDVSKMDDTKQYATIKFGAVYNNGTSQDNNNSNN